MAAFGNFATHRNVKLAAAYSSVTFAGISGLVQLILAVYPLSMLQGGRSLLIVISASLAFGIIRAFPKNTVDRELKNPTFKVTIKKGDLFEEDSHLVIGFTDTFDTDSNDAEIISPASVQAQFLRRVYSGEVDALDRDLTIALDGYVPEGIETREVKPKGRLTRYPLGTVAVLGSFETRYYCVAYSRMGNNLAAQSSVDALWLSLSRLWDVIDETGNRRSVSMPVIGSDLARVDNLDYESIVKMVALSFVARSRKSIITRALTIVIHPRDCARIDMNEMAAFLNSL
ncbi:macro domain-containing protein [Streptomyces sp. NBC_00076]|uniref:macro domain-containing protein n=1 Tax=Streptomyces sp. NBC_00076 TaxID=2975642 RepID=UPI003247B2A7